MQTTDSTLFSIVSQISSPPIFGDFLSYIPTSFHSSVRSIYIEIFIIFQGAFFKKNNGYVLGNFYALDCAQPVFYKNNTAIITTINIRNGVGKNMTH